MKQKSVILLSSGLDSTVNFYVAKKETDVELAITFNYGQKAAPKEIERSQEIAELNKVKHVVIDLPWLKDLGKSSLTQASQEIPVGASVSIDNRPISEKSAKSVWVPNRNGVFLNIAAAYAESLNADVIVPGFNVEEAQTFPDNSFEFLRATRKVLSFSTANQVDVVCYTINMNKNEIVKLGLSYQVPFQKLWVCYQNKEKWCGQCESCQRALRAFKANRTDILSSFEKI
jgi:7-cyano-7-deazaguanine synthase